MPVRDDDPRPPSVQIADDLREQMRAGQLARGAKLPSTRELAADYGVANMTAQQAVRRLKDQELVISYPGRGVFVADRAVPAPAGSPSGQPQNLDEALAMIKDLNTRLERLESARDHPQQDLRPDTGPSSADGPEIE